MRAVPSISQAWLEHAEATGRKRTETGATHGGNGRPTNKRSRGPKKRMAVRRSKRRPHSGPDAKKPTVRVAQGRKRNGRGRKRHAVNGGRGRSVFCVGGEVDTYLNPSRYRLNRLIARQARDRANRTARTNKPRGVCRKSHIGRRK